jgi:Dolichyl-phosphate-mannose-protein mannosyltransferase
MPFNLLTENKRLVLRPILLTLSALEGFFAFYCLLQVPRSPQGGLAANITVLLLVLAGLLTLTLLSAAYYTWRWPQKEILNLSDAQHPRRLTILSFLALAIIPLVIITYYLLHSLYLGTNNALYRLAFLNLDPFLLWFGLAALQFLVWQFITHPEKLKSLWSKNRKLCRTALLSWGTFLLLALVVRISGLRVPETSMTAWAIPSVPLLEWQIWLSGLVAALFFVFDKSEKPSGTTAQSRLQSLLRSDRFWFFLIWAISLIIWTSQPLLPNHYATAGRAPNFEIYPFSDGMTYDQTAQSILIGNGLMGDEIPARPLYTVFLAIIHAIVGQDYNQVILVQMIVLAFFPAVLYLLGREFGSRPAGIMLALLTILRETHSIQAAPFTRSVSNVQLYFSEIPTALGLSLFLLFCLRWMKQREQPGLNPLLAGGMLGISMLIRTQSLAVLPFVLLFALLTLWPDWKKLILPAGLLLAGLAISVAPWLYRNYQITGAVVFDHPMSQNWEMARRYATAFEEDPWKILDRQPGEDDGEFVQRLNEYTLNAIITHPGYVLKTVGINLANGELTSLLTLPIRPDPIQSWGELFRTRRAFWETWSEAPTTQMILLLTLNLGLVALGVGAAWRNLKWIGLIPLSMSLMYNLATAAFQVSGMRFVLPVTWIVHLYFGLGVLALVELLWKFFNPTKESTTANEAQTAVRPLQWWQVVLGLALFALIGSSLILAEKVVPQRFPPQTDAQILTELLEIPAVQQNPALQDSLNNFPTDSGLMILKGRAIYPRYYDQDKVEPDTAKTAYATLSYPRVVFFFLSEESNQVIALPIPQVPEHFPHPMDIILIGCQQEAMIEARLVAALDGSDILYTSNLSDITKICEP